MTRPADTRRCCGEVPCTCSARKAAARERARAVQAPATVVTQADPLPAGATRYHCLCALCGARWAAGELDDCPACGGAARLIDRPAPCRHERLTGRPGDLGRLCVDCGALRVASP